MPNNGKLTESAFRELCGCNAQAMCARLSAAGLSDISWNELLVLAALNLGLQAGPDLKRELGFSGGAADEMTDNLVLHGYLGCQDDPDDPGRTIITFTGRGGMALSVARKGILADRWASFPFRPGDIVISTPPKNGTTWMQMICALLIFQAPDLQAPIEDLSPWMDWEEVTRDEVFERLITQKHRRFIKTHTLLADINVVPQVTYIVVGRNPLDAAISAHYQRENIRSARQNNSRPAPEHNIEPREWLLNWIAREYQSPSPLASLPSTLRHISDAWARRDAPNIVLMHYEDLSADLEGQMRYLATRLGITVHGKLWPGLVKAATFEQMRAAADRIRPLGGLVEPKDFFRAGRSGSGSGLLTAAELADYHARAAKVLPPDLMAWLHRLWSPAKVLPLY